MSIYVPFVDKMLNQTEEFICFTRLNIDNQVYIMLHMSADISNASKLSGNVISKTVSNVDNAILRASIKLGGNMLSEGFEEGAQEILTPLFHSMVTGEDYSVQSEEVLYSAFMGAMTAGILESGGTVSGEVGLYKTGKALQDSGITAQQLAEVGKGLSAESAAYQLAGRVNEDTDAYTMGRLFYEIGAEVTAENVADIKKSLERKGVRAKDAKILAEGFAAVATGAELTDAQIAAIEANDVLAKTVADVLLNPKSTVSQRTESYNGMIAALPETQTAVSAKFDKVLSKTTKTGKVETSGKDTKVAAVDATESATDGAEVAAKAVEDTAVRKTAEVSEGVYEASEDGKTRLKSTGQAVTVQKIASIKDGKMTLALEDGSKVDASDVEYGSADEAIVYETVASLATNAAAANLMLSTYEGSGVPALVFAKGMEEAYRYGSVGMPVEQMLERGSFVDDLTDYQINTGYELGKMFGGKKTAREQAAVRRSKDAKPADTSKGKVHFDGDRSKLNKTQRASLDVMEMLAKSLGVQIYVFESEVGADGRRKGANGWYDPSDGSIHIDLYAGADGKGTMLFTVAHELTHFIRQWSPVKFKVLANFLMKQYGKNGVSVRELVENQMEKAKRNGRELTFEEAYEEVVADSMESMLTDGNVIQWMAELRQQDKGLWQKICDWFKDLAGKLKAVVDSYKGVQPDSTEGKLVADMKDVIGILESLYQDALVDASENYNAAGAQKNTAHEGGVKYSLNRNAKTELHKALYDRNYRDKVLLRDETPAIMLAQKGVRKLPMTMNASHIRENVFTEAEALKLGLRVNDSIHYHGLGEDFFLRIIDGLDNVKEAYRGTKQADDPARRENYFLLVSEFTDKDGNVVNVPVYIDEHARYNRVFIDTNKISTVFGRDNFREYIRRQLQQKNLVRIKNRNITASESSALIAEVYSNDVSKGSIRDPDGIVNKKLSDRDPDYQKVNKVLDQENQKLKEDVSYLKELVKIQRTVTNGTKFTKSSVEGAAIYLKKAAGAKGDTREFAAILKPFYEYIASGKELTWEGVKEQAQPAVEWLRDHVEVKKERSEYAQDILKQLHGSKVYLDESQMAEVEHRFGDCNDYRKSLRPVLERERARINKATVDSVFDGLVQSYKELEASPYAYIKCAYDDATYNYLDSLKAEIKGTVVKDMTLHLFCWRASWMSGQIMSMRCPGIMEQFRHWRIYAES